MSRAHFNHCNRNAMAGRCRFGETAECPVLQDALDEAVLAYDEARMDVHGVAPEHRERDRMSDRNKESIRPMILAAVTAYLGVNQ